MQWRSKKFWFAALLALFLAPALSMASAQMGGPPPNPRPPMQRAFHMRMERWWDNPKMVKRLGITPEQQQSMDKIYLDHKLKLIDLHAKLEQQELLMGPLLGADHPDESKILSQIDNVAQARANVEKEFARMLLGIRSQLTLEQWKKLKTIYLNHMHPMHPCEQGGPPRHNHWHNHKQNKHMQGNDMQGPDMQGPAPDQQSGPDAGPQATPPPPQM